MNYLQLPELSYLQELFDYDKCSGLLIWKERPINHFKSEPAFKRWNKIFPGNEAGTISRKTDGKKYKHVNICGKLYQIHRIIAELCGLGLKEDLTIDHINGNGIDNRLNNLRVVSLSDQQKNARLRANNTSGFNGVWFDNNRGKWVAAGRSNNERIHIGVFITKEEAIIARKKFDLDYNFHKNHGFDRDL